MTNTPTPTAGDLVTVQDLQERVRTWTLECFGDEIACDLLERMDRFTEEALELVQSLGYTPERAHALVEYVFGREPGEPPQETGGTLTTLAALCNVAHIDIFAAFLAEVERITQPAMVAKIRAKQAAKPTGSALPVALATSPAHATGAAMREGPDLRSLRWDYMPSYGAMDFDQLREAVSEANIGNRHSLGPFDPSYSAGHQMVGGCNYNSLNRIVTTFVRAALSSPAPEGEAAQDDTADMAAIGRSFMASLEMITAMDGPYKDWTPAEDPAELVLDLYNDLTEARSAEGEAAPGVEPETLGKFGWHPDPVIDFEYEIEKLESRFDCAKHRTAKPGDQPETIAAVLADITRAMNFKAGGTVEGAVAKNRLRGLERQAIAATKCLAAHCKGYMPDYQAGGDCVNCGHIRADHPEFAPPSVKQEAGR